MKRSLLCTLSFIFAFLGFLDSTYLTIVHYKHIIPPCTIAGSKCEMVLTSQYATIGPIPIALLGALFYLTVMVLLAIYFEIKHRIVLNVLLILSGLCVIIAIGLLYIQAGILHEFCQYCVASEIIDFLFFGTILVLWKQSLPKQTY